MAALQRYHCDPLPAEGEEVVLSADESHHLCGVMRAVPGVLLVLMDGRGSFREAQLVVSDRRACRVRVGKALPAPRRSQVTLAFGLTKAPALEALLRRASEVGVGGFQPLQTAHGERFQSWNGPRWEKIIREASKQCGAAFFPPLAPPIPLTQWLPSRPSGRGLAFCDEEEREGQGTILPGEWDVLVGPEGGWAPSERDAIFASGAVRFGLGPLRLRAETAAVVSVVLLKKALGEM